MRISMNKPALNKFLPFIASFYFALNGMAAERTTIRYTCSNFDQISQKELIDQQYVVDYTIEGAGLFEQYHSANVFLRSKLTPETLMGSLIERRHSEQSVFLTYQDRAYAFDFMVSAHRQAGTLLVRDRGVVEAVTQYLFVCRP